MEGKGTFLGSCLAVALETDRERLLGRREIPAWVLGLGSMPLLRYIAAQLGAVLCAVSRGRVLACIGVSVYGLPPPWDEVCEAFLPSSTDEVEQLIRGWEFSEWKVRFPGGEVGNGKG